MHLIDCLYNEVCAVLVSGGPVDDFLTCMVQVVRHLLRFKRALNFNPAMYNVCGLKHFGVSMVIMISSSF